MKTTASNRRSVTRRTVLTGAAVVLLVAAAAGCSSSKNSTGGDIAGAQSGSPTAASSSPTPTISASPGWTAPTFAFPSDVTMQLDGFTASDPAKNAAVRDLGYAMSAYEEGLATGATDRPALARYWSGLANAAVAKSITSYKAGGHRITGISHFLRPNLTLKDASSATATLCEDQSKSFPKDLGTGAVVTGTPSDDDYVAWNLTLQHDPAGDWQVNAVNWTHGVLSCKP
ncbi:hypothetical protein LN042_23285 [Kitasatospora sp. RB6PN24]|uniref:hypothetical protein n=1 Tax=Kitasatospora humi TaxID=2893891 RepID=UPI001E45C908|nr:hypothetical protein [Kitasatospora humi]MCC9309961.1 hypothetical protein [Kitasatospora humi]